MADQFYAFNWDYKGHTAEFWTGCGWSRDGRDVRCYDSVSALEKSLDPSWRQGFCGHIQSAVAKMNTSAGQKYRIARPNGHDYQFYSCGNWMAHVYSDAYLDKYAAGKFLSVLQSTFRTAFLWSDWDMPYSTEAVEPIAKPTIVVPQVCKRCNEGNPWAEPNQPDGSFLCFSCRRR